MANNRPKAKWTPAQIKTHIQKIDQIIENHKRRVKKGEVFTAVTPEDIERKLKHQNSPMIIFQTGSWVIPTPVGGTFSYNVGIYNPDPAPANWLFAHVWTGAGNIVATVGTYLLNVDTRFPRLTQPQYPGLSIGSGEAAMLSFSIKIPFNVEQTNYLGNCCLMRAYWNDVGTYLDRSLFVFTVP